MDNTENETKSAGTGKLAQTAGRSFPLQVCRSAAGFYIGTLDEDGLPCSRESQEYWRREEQAQAALDHRLWTQKPNP